MSLSEDTDDEVQTKAFDFSDEFQKKIATAIIVDQKFASQIYEVLEIDYFKPRWIKAILGEHKNFFLKYGTFPSNDSLSHLVAERYFTNDKTKNLAPYLKAFLVDCNNADFKELKYIKEETLEFCRKAAMQKGLLAAVDLLGASNDTKRYERIQNIITKVTMAGSDTTLGLALEKDVEARYTEQARKTVPTGVPEFDDVKILNGGLGAGEIGIVISPSGGGKSHWLTQFGAAAMLAGKNVAHFTFELRESLIATRYDSNLTDIPSLECVNKIPDITEFYRARPELGKLRIKYYPTGTATVNTLRSYLEKLQSTEGFRPDLILVDYAGIMRSTERHESLRHELKFITEELRAFADEFNCPLWTALQSNRDGVDADFLEINNAAESFAQVFIADFIMGWSRKMEDKVSGIGIARVMKNRAGYDGVNFNMALDTSRSKVSSLQLIGEAPAYPPKFNPQREEKRDNIRNYVTALNSGGASKPRDKSDLT